MMSGKDAYKQFGIAWMLACTGDAAGVVLGVVLGGVSSVVKLAVLEK